MLHLVANISSNLTQYTSGLDGWEGEYEDPPSGEHIFVQCQRGGTKDPKEMGQVKCWVGVGWGIRVDLSSDG